MRVPMTIKLSYWRCANDGALVGGQAVRLGPRIGKGGEGEVYKVEGLDCAAKVYTLKDDANREPKIAAMIRSLSQYNSQFAAFPLAIAHQRDGRFAGFLMNLVTGHKALHELYSPAARKRHSRMPIIVSSLELP